MIASKVRQHFLIPRDPSACWRDFEPLLSGLSDESPMRAVAMSFRASLASAISVVALPFQFANASVRSSHYQRIHTAERIEAEAQRLEDSFRSGTSKSVTEDHYVNQAAKRAQAKMSAFAGSEEGMATLAKDTCDFLLRSLQFGMQESAQVLLQQGVVLVWSVFEVFCRDTFELLINSSPELGVRLITSDKKTPWSELKRVPLELLLSHGLDLSNQLGTVLLEKQDFSKLTTIKTAFNALFPGESQLHDSLGSRELWMLNQRRHVVVHRRGVIDRAYLSATGANLCVGTTIKVEPRDLESAMSTVIATGTVILEAAIKAQN